MIDVIVYKPSPYGLVLIYDKPLGFIIYHIKHERVDVSYNTRFARIIITIMKVAAAVVGITVVWFSTRGLWYYFNNLISRSGINHG